MMTDDDIVWTCQYCGIHNTLWIDLTVNGKQDLVEDCRICCRPNQIIISKDREDNLLIESRPINE